MTDEPESLITGAMAAAIGRTGEPFTRTIEQASLLRYAEAYEEEPDLLNAIRAGDRSVPLPVYALMGQNGGQRQPWGPQHIPDLPEHSLLAGNGWELFAPLHLGDEITVTPRVADIQERIGGRVGHSLFVHEAEDCVNQDGVLVARITRIITYFPKRWGDDR